MCPAPLGNEHAAKQLIRSMLPNGLEISEDVAGSAIVRKPGEKPGLTFFASLSQAKRRTAHGNCSRWERERRSNP